uniref:Uncharacterized protein n=1 Tax=Plectus sambesii TaxID=2011161 RepID=A0A914UQL5_9BILA
MRANSILPSERRQRGADWRDYLRICRRCVWSAESTLATDETPTTPSMRPPKGAAVMLPLLILLIVGAATVNGRRISKRGSKAFLFTQPVYNATISENARGKVFAEGDGPANQKMGVHVMPDAGQVRFKIVQGDTRQYFKAHTRMVGDFAFLRIRLHPQTDVMLNRELKDHYQFLIKATFRREGKRNLETTTVVNLRIADQNDLTPLFLPSDYVAQVAEDTAPFTQITQVSASDADEGLNGQVYYSLVDASSDFAVHPVSGVVTSLGRLSAGHYSLTVRAEDRASRLFYSGTVGLGPGRPSSEATVTVTVVKANIFPPTIVAESKAIDPYANKAQLAAVLRISDQDEKQHGTINRVFIAAGPSSDLFVLRPDVEENVFLLETLAGVKLPIDERISVDIVAVDGGTPELSATVPVAVQLLEKGRPTIVFAREYAFAVNESSPLQSILGFVTANASKPHANAIKYSIVGDADTFRINEKTGLLYLNEPLDFEQKVQYQVTVRATVDGVSEDTNILVDVLDSNDNSPQFEGTWAKRHAIAVSRDTALESTVATIAATDRDSGDNGRVSFRIANEDHTPFIIDHYTGELKLRSPLSSAGVSQWKLLIRASDRGAPLQRESELTLWIYVNGTTKPTTTGSEPIRSHIENAHAPLFASELYETSVAENALAGTVVSTVVATDADWGYSALVRYALQLDGNDLGHFTVDTLSGELRVLKPFAAPATYDLMLTATDAGVPPKSTTTKIRVSVTDVNDHAPVFDRPLYRATVAEDGRVGAQVLQVTAVDADVGNNGSVRYRLATKTDDFKIDAVSGVLSVARPLDREIKEHYDLMITAYDLGSPSLSSDTNASISVMDYNDNSPRCLQKVHKVQIAEDWPQGALLTCVGAEDVDAGENGRLSFELDSTRSDKDLPFRIDAKSGCVFIDSPQPLDFEKRPLYNLTVEVSDNGQPQFSTICSLLVELIDVNENLHPPVFDDFVLEASVLENEPIGTEVTTVKATDPDNPTGRVSYAIVGGDGLGLFAIDGRGTVRTTSTLDRETSAFYWLVIAARDTANVPLTSVVHLYIAINDTNDNAPRPDMPIYFASVAENSPENTVVVKVEATDADDPTAEVRYRISRGDPQSFFAIDPKTGYITTQGRRHLDRETNKEHELEVTISDRGEPRLSTPVLVVVSVSDVNDNPPVFKQPIYNFNVPSSLGNDKGGPIALCRVFAADADEGVNARLFYNITDGDGHFAIDEKGELSSARPLEGGKSYALTVQATDMGSPSKSTTTRVMIDVAATPAKKKNNRKPTLPAGDWSELHISDADSVGETIGLIDASDPDDDVLWWSIIDGNINDTFSLRSDTGELLLAKPLDYANVSAFDIEYAVSDGAETSRGKIKVHVSKSHQVRPEFSAVHYKAQMAESTAIGTTVAKLKAALPGVTASAKADLSSEKISYSLHSTDSPITAEKFRVDARTGNVVLVDTLDHEAQKSHHLIVAARCGSLVNLASVTIDVTDENDSAPRFLSSHYEAKVLATAAVGTWIVTIQAHDSDSGQNSALTYAISSGNELGMFSLDTATGAIVAAKELSLDYPETMLAVRVTDGGKPPMSDTSTVRILIVMDETSPPRFLMDPYTLSVKESAPVGTQIGAVYAESAAGVRYKVEQPTLDEIEIHPASGAIFLARKLDREQSSYLNFTVVAVGSAGGSSSTRVQVTVVDSNDHAPVFAHASYEGSVLENMPTGTAVLTSDGAPLVVSATDADTGPNALVNYKIATPWADDYFSVDFGTGAIRTKVPLDFELTKSLTFAVLASDMGSPAMTSPVAALVTVTVKDSNDEKPVLVPQHITAALALPTAKGVILGRAKAVDFDSVGELRYSISDERTSRLFAIDRLHGTITVATADTALFKAKEYSIPISVSDGVHSTEGTVAVSVVDYSKTAASSLQFKKSAYQVSVVENTTSAQPSTILTLTVVGAQLGERITYRLLNPTEGFTLGSSSGELKTTGVPLDREKTPNVTLIVQARDQQVPPRIAQTVVTVDVNDTNDCMPRFVNLPYYAVVPLDSNVGEKVIKVNALDDDKGPNGQVRYSLIDSASGRFTINSWDGRITVAKAFPHGMASQDFTLVVEDAAGRKGFTTLLLNVLDVNDNAPVFVAKSYKATASTNATLGESVLIVLAVDPDAGDQVEYSVFDKDVNENLHQFFKMNNRRGLLSVRRNLKPLEGQKLSFFVRATDRGNPPKQSEVAVELTIVDDATLVPKFSEELYHFNVVENAAVATVIGRLRQDDASALNDVRYSILPSPEGLEQDMPFSVDPTSGTLTVVKQLDRETKDEWRFSVSAATDRATSVSVVMVRVDDFNDNAPVFEMTYEKLSISEDAAVGTSVTVFSATDKDLNAAGKTIFSIEGPDAESGVFKVDGESGWLMVDKKLDRETKDLFEFTVRASDQGRPTPLSTVTRVVIAITDANDCAPKFSSVKYQFQVDEGAQLGTVVGTISVTDGDLPPNNATKLFIVGGNERQLFGLRDSGDLFVQMSLRSDRASPHRLVIIASDDRHSTTAEAVVSVLPASDRPPQCERDFVDLVVGEDAEVGAEVFLLVADDKDAGTELIYTLSGDDDKHFAFTNRGALVIAKPLDRETREEYLLTLRATDTSGRSCTSTIAVSVADVNDEAPVFEKSLYTIAVRENLNITDEEAFFLLNVKAVDNDSGFGGKVKYSLKSDQSDDILRYFKMDEMTGALLLMESLDREDKIEYNITVIAMDSDPKTPKSSTAWVHVQVVDVNDNPPVFERVRYLAEVSEQEAIGFEVVKVHAVGGDHGETITYQLVSPSSAMDYFQVNEASGAVTLRKSVDYEKQKQYTLTVEATDSGSPPLTVSTTVDIAVLDANDHAPKFAQTLYQATVEENSKVGTKVVQVVARDADSGEFGRLAYRLTSATEEFAIDDNGWITVKSSIDRETMSGHRLTVEVSDGGRPPQSDSAAVVIVVADKNDNPPIFAECNLTAVVQEGGELGRKLLTTTITDADADPNAGPFQLKIEGVGAESFEFDQMTLKTTARLVYSNKDIYLLTVTATDNGQPSMSSECPLTIYVREESKHPPEMKPLEVTINSLMGEFPGALVAKAHATDKDARDMLRYALVDHQEYFTLNSQTGEINARQGLPGGIHRLNVSVTDGRFTTVAPYTIEVEPIDQDTLDHSVSIRFAQLSPNAFVSGPKHQFEKSVARILNVRPKSVRIISLQEADETTPKKERKRKKLRHRRHINGSTDDRVRDLDVLFTVSKGKDSGYYRPNFVRQRLEEQMADFSRNEHLQVVSMVTEVCRRDMCVRGDCRDRLWLDDVNFYSVVTPEGAFVAPTHFRTYECICKDGYGGKRCDVPTNACSRDPCDGDLMCVPKENAIGFECVCPPGTTGASCQEQICPNGDCARGGAISLDGNGYVQYTLANPFDRRLELAIEMQTVASDGVLLYGRGVHDYHALELHGGYLEYRWDCGAGPGAAKLLDARVSDGKWHTVKISRRGRHSKLTLDDTFTVEGESPVGNDVVNLRNGVGKLTFGAEVIDHPTLQGHQQVRRGFNGCLNRLYVDGFELPKSKQGLKLFNVEMGCRAPAGGACGAVPCQNFGTCAPADDGDYRCSCHPRYSGRNCEIDLNPCASDPCPTGIPCQGLFNDFFCRCPTGFTGKTCQMKGDFDECLSSPCGSFGVCISIPRSYICNCTNGWTGPTCREKPGSNLDANPWGWPLTVLELIVIAVVLVVLLVLACLIVCVCRRTGRYRYHKAPYVQNNNDLMLETQPHVHNPLVSRSGFGSKYQDVPPPLPPRGNRGFHPHRNSKLSNLESAQLTGLPTVQVRPLSIHDRGAGGENCSDSPNGSRHWRPVMRDENSDTPASCRRVGERGNLESARNYGSAAEELEQLGRFGAHDILRTFGKPLPAEDEANLNRRERMDRQELLDGLDRLSIDTIERLKERNHDVPDDDRHRSLASSIQCLPMDDGENGYHWDYSDWSSTLGNAKEENGSDLPAGVSALDETDSEFLADDDHITIPPMSATGDFRRELLKLQRLTKEANDIPVRKPSREESASTSATDNPSDYMTMKPLVSQQRHLDKYLPKPRAPPDSTQSQRRPLLDADGDMSQSSDSDGADSCDAVVQYGFPSQKKRRRNRVEHSSDKALYDEPPRLPLDDSDTPSKLSSFKLPHAVSSDPMQCSMEGQLSNPRSNSDVSGICDIDDSEYAGSEHGQAKIVSKQTVV